MKKQAVLLKDPRAPVAFEIDIQLQEKQTARFTYSSRMMAELHYDQLRGQMAVGGLAIKDIQFKELYE